MKLSTFANINSGIYSRTINDGEVYYIQARDFDENRNIARNLVPVLSYTENFEKHFLKKGDLLIVAKGSSFLSAVFDGTYKNAVASTVFLIARVNNESTILPEYLSWFLNSPSTQSYLLSLARGTSIPSINKKTLLEFDVPVPEIKKQKMVLELESLRKKEALLNRKIRKLKESQMNQIIFNSINN